MKNAAVEMNRIEAYVKNDAVEMTRRGQNISLHEERCCRNEQDRSLDEAGNVTQNQMERVPTA